MRLSNLININYFSLQKDTLKVIYAFGGSDPESDDVIELNYHGTIEVGATNVLS